MKTFQLQILLSFAHLAQLITERHLGHLEVYIGACKTKEIKLPELDLFLLLTFYFLLPTA